MSSEHAMVSAFLPSCINKKQTYSSSVKLLFIQDKVFCSRYLEEIYKFNQPTYFQGSFILTGSLYYDFTLTTPLLCTPCTVIAPMTPVKYGSSPKPSQFRPDSGIRAILTSGPS